MNKLKTAFEYKDDFQTPKAVCRYMASLIAEGIETVLEPTPGMGNLVSEIEAIGKYKVTAPSDFFLLDRAIRFDQVVMNPPFSSKYAIMDNAPDNFIRSGMRLGYFMLTECMQKSDNIIALMPWFTLSDSDVRLRALKKFGMRSITALPRKTFEYARIQTVVIELVKGFSGKTEFKVLDLMFKSSEKEYADINHLTLF